VQGSFQIIDFLSHQQRFCLPDLQDFINQAIILHGRDRRRILAHFSAKKESGKNRSKNIDLCKELFVYENKILLDTDVR
jgi:hypothetical protein